MQVRDDACLPETEIQCRGAPRTCCLGHRPPAMKATLPLLPPTTSNTIYLIYSISTRPQISFVLPTISLGRITIKASQQNHVCGKFLASVALHRNDRSRLGCMAVKGALQTCHVSLALVIHTCNWERHYRCHQV